MRMYGIPLTGSLIVQANSPSEAFEVAKNWSAIVLEDSITADAIPIPTNIEIAILIPQNSSIKDVTDEVIKMKQEAEAK